MRETHHIEREIDRARADLEASLGALKHVVQDKLDIRKQVRDAIARGKEEGRELFDRAKRGVREQPLAAALVALAVFGITVALIVVGRRARAPRRMLVDRAVFDQLVSARDQLLLARG